MPEMSQCEVKGGSTGRHTDQARAMLGNAGLLSDPALP
jgi:hypothetical protein